jgi:hypothetical protein
MSTLTQERIEQLQRSVFNFTDLEEPEPNTALQPITIASQPNPRAELEVVRALPQPIQGLLMPVVDPSIVHGPKPEPGCCPLCGAPEDWDD